MKKITFHVISHTHWDREWYLPFETYRVELVDLIDELLNILEQNNNFIFHLDGYTLLIDDYLEIRPDKKKLIKKYIKSGNILTGPWYVLSDQFLTSGESTIRNLFYGISEAKEYGNVMMVGYLPDQFGQIAQLPQIFKGFNINSAVLGRGIQSKKAEHIWYALNGDYVLTISLTHWYNNAQRLPAKKEELNNYLSKIYENQSPTTQSGNILLMNGCDHLFAQPNLLSILKSSDKHSLWTLKQSKLPEVIETILNNVDIKDLPVRKGELRDDNDKSILASTLSSRVYLKLSNYKIQTQIEKIIEPLAAILAMSNKVNYPHDQLKYAWKLFLQNHAHDSICGCSVDEVHREMETRYEKTTQLLERLQKNLLLRLSKNTESLEFNLESKNYLQLFNLTNIERNEVIELKLEFPLEKPEKGEIKELQLLHKKENINFEILESHKLYKMVSSRHEIPALQAVQVIRLLLNTVISPFSVSTLDIKTNSGGQKIISKNKPGKSNLEFKNKNYKLKINSNGTLNITLNKSNHKFKNLHFLTLENDYGDLYRFIPGKTNKITVFYNWDIKVIEENKYRKVFLLKSKDSKIKTSITCYSNSNRIDFNTKINNKHKNKRLRVHFPTSLNKNSITADTQFGTLERARPPKDWKDPAFVQPLYNWLDHSDNKKGLAFFGGGLAEYELYESGNGFAVTLIRSIGKLSIVKSHSLIETPEGQCNRMIEFSYALFPHTGGWKEANLHNEGLRFQVPILKNQSNQKFDLASFITFPKELILSSIKRAEEKENLYIVRLFNSTGSKLNNCNINLNIKPQKVYLLNLKEEIIYLIAKSKNKFSITINPYQIVTFGLEI